MLLEYNSEFNDFSDKIADNWRERDNNLLRDGYEMNYKIYTMN